MKTFIQIILTLFVVLIIYFIILRKIFFAGMLALSNTAQIITSLIIAIIAAILLWRKIGNISNTLPACIIAGGVTLGLIGLILGVYVPIILNRSTVQGPLIGILLTGPAGILLGLVVGGAYWYPKVKKKRGISFDNKDFQKK
jgi:hypothetical protein